MNIMKNFLKQIHHAIPLKIRNLYMPALSRVLYFFQDHLNAVFPPVVLYEGRERQSRIPLAFAYAGNIHQMHNYWDHCILDDEFKKLSLGRQFFLNVLPVVRKTSPHCGFLIMEQSPLTAPWLGRKPGFLIPFWIRMEIDIRRPLKELFAEQRSDIERLIRKHHLSYEFSKAPKHFEDFYNTMYVPYIEMRYTDAAGINTYHSFLESIPRSEMILIKKDGVVIAAAMVEFIKGRPFLRRLGIVDANQEYVRCGAIGAIYYFWVQELKRRGHSVMDIGGTRPLLSDGLTRYKISFAAKLCAENSKHSCVKFMVTADSPAVRGFLTRSPFLFKNTKKKICRALFIEPTEKLTVQEIHRLLNSSYCEGIEETHIIRLGDQPLPEGMKKLGTDPIFYVEKIGSVPNFDHQSIGK